MEFVVEAVSTTRKSIALSLTAEEVTAAIDATVADYRKDLSIPGFRKGKVPASVVERRFKDEILARATQDKLNDAVRTVFDSEKLTPLSGLDVDNQDPFTKGEAFACKLTFDVLPDIDLPSYEGLSVDQTKSVVTEDEMDAVLTRLRENFADLAPMTEDRLPQDGDVVDVDYSGFDEQGEPVDDVKGEHFSVTLGQKQALDDFEALVKTIKVGEEKSGSVAFPADYHHAPLAGKTVTFHIKVNSIQARELPALDDAFAQKVGQENMERLRAAVEEHTLSSKTQNFRAEAMKKLLDGLLEQVSFDIPESMLNLRMDRILNERAMRLQRMGKSLDDLGKKPEELHEEAKAEALESLRPQVFLMAVANKENLSVAEQEVEMAIYSMAMRAGQDYAQVRDAYQRSGLMHELRDRILADKAMEMIYGKATLNEVEPTSEEA